MKNINLNDYVTKAVNHYWGDHSANYAFSYFNRNTIIDELAIAINPDQFKNDGNSNLKAMIETFFDKDDIEEAVTGFTELFTEKINEYIIDQAEEEEYLTTESTKIIYECGY